jgi:hypothetical protein
LQTFCKRKKNWKRKFNKEAHGYTHKCICTYIHICIYTHTYIRGILKEGEGYKERVWEGEYGGNIMDSGMKVEN